MKKILAVIMTLVLAVGSIGLCLAEGSIDFSGYSLEELLEIRSNLADEIASRPGGEKMVLGSGQYKIGEALPAGVYTFKFVQNGDSDVTRTDYYVYENESMYKYDVDRLWLGDMPRVEGSFKGDGETRISLYPGEYLSLRYNGAEVARVGMCLIVAVAIRFQLEPLFRKEIIQSEKRYLPGHIKYISVEPLPRVFVSSRMLRRQAIPSTKVRRPFLIGIIPKEPLL